MIERTVLASLQRRHWSEGVQASAGETQVLLGGVEWAGVSEVQSRGQVCTWGGGCVKADPALRLVLPGGRWGLSLLRL